MINLLLMMTSIFSSIKAQTSRIPNSIIVARD